MAEAGCVRGVSAGDGGELRLLIAAGVGDVAGTFELWRRGERDRRIMAIPYSEMMFDLCRRLGASALIVPDREGEPVSSGRIEIRPMARNRGVSGWRYYREQWRYAGRLADAARGFGADAVIVTTWLPLGCLSAFARRGLPVLLSVHNTIWTMGGEPSPGLRGRVLRRWAGHALRRHVGATICVSPECRRQIEAVAGRPKGPVRVFVPQYDPASLRATPPPSSSEPFRLLFAGRIEHNKGVFDVVEAASRLKAQRPGAFRWTICGAGSRDDELRRAIGERGLESDVAFPGYLEQPQLSEQIDRCHATLTPTLQTFAEGIAKLPVEGVIVGRPALTSTAVPAGEVVRSAAERFPAGDVEAMIQAVQRLRDDEPHYRRLVAGCDEHRGMFFDPSRSYGACLEWGLETMFGSDRVRPADAEVHS